MTEDDDTEREFTRALFADPDRDLDRTLFGLHDGQEAGPDRRTGNFVPREGSIVERSSGDWETRQWVNDLFTYSGVMP